MSVSGGILSPGGAKILAEMSEEDRRGAFVQGMAALEQQYGMTVIPVPEVRQYGGMVQFEARLTVAPVNGWGAGQKRPDEAGEV